MSITELEPASFRRPQLLSQHVYEQLKVLIISNELPPGEALVEERLAAQWGISRTPLRSALARLERDGLVTTVPHKGCVVTDILPEDVHEVYQVREALETMAVQLATPRIPDQVLDELARLFDEIAAELAQGRYEKYIPSDAHFHARIMAHVPNRQLQLMLARIYDQISRIRNHSHAWPGEHMREAHEEHTLILGAMRRRDPEAAGAAMRDHLRNITRRAIALLRRPAPQGGME